MMSKILNMNEPHMACLFLVDTSGSMSGESINSLNVGINRFKEEVCRDKRTKEILDVAILEFNSNVRIVQDWCPIEYMEPVNLEANGGTDIECGLRVAIDMVLDRNRLYCEVIGVCPYMPMIVMVTDGYFNSSITKMAAEIAELDEKGKLKLWSFVVGDADKNVLKKLCGKKRIFRLEGQDFTYFFDWQSIGITSLSRDCPGERTRLPENVDINIFDDWM